MKELVVKDWLWEKIARENNAPRVWGGHIDCIFAETEKAYKVMMGAVSYTVFTWIPKSQCEFVESDNETRVFCSYEEAIAYKAELRSAYC